MYRKFLSMWPLLRDHFRPSLFRSSLFRASQVLLAIAILVIVVARPTETASTNAEALSLIKELEQQNPKYLTDMHGNADKGLQRLMALRFQATTDVQAAIDRMQKKPERAKLVAALYRVLGFVKDPASVPWLEVKLRGSERQTIHEAYMPHWQDEFSIGFGNNEGFGGWTWLTGRERWITFFIDAYTSEPNSDRRLELMNVVKGFDDPAAMQFFLTQRKALTNSKEVDADPVNAREVLLVEAYLYQHDVPIEEKRMVSAINALVADPRNRKLLIGTAAALRNKAFVPYLISTLDVAEEYISNPYFPSSDGLKYITFELDIETSADWKSWYLLHQGESRKLWLQSAFESFKKRLARDPTGAQQWFAKKAIYYWNEIAVLQLIRTELLARPEFHSKIAGWINMTYSEFNRAKLKPVADELLRHPEQLENWARQRLQQCRFEQPNQPITWEMYVRMSNWRL